MTFANSNSAFAHYSFLARHGGLCQHVAAFYFNRWKEGWL